MNNENEKATNLEAVAHCKIERVWFSVSDSLFIKKKLAGSNFFKPPNGWAEEFRVHSCGRKHDTFASFKQILSGTLRTVNATQTGMQSDDYTHGLWFPHYRASVWRTASFWIKMWLENNDFRSSWDTVCTITSLFQQDVASRRQHCTSRLILSKPTLDFSLRLLPLCDG